MNKTKRVVFTSVAVTIATVGMLNIADSIYAGTSASAATSGLSMSATITPSATISLSADVSLDVVPSANGTFASSGVTVNAYTNSSNCTVTMTTASDDMSLTSQTTDSVIGPLEANTTYTSGAFLTDAWGYSLDGTNFSRVSASNQIGTFDATTASWKTLTFATKLTQATKPGTYTGTVTFVSTCDPPLPPAVNYMQNVSSWIGNVSAGEEIEVVDSRDGNTYTALKLTNGRMLMTQNLDHDIKTDGSVTYNSTTTDISSAWSPSTATTTTTTWANSSNNGNNIPQSYDPGDLYWNGTLDSDWDGDGTLSNSKYISSTGDSHYHVGNFYSWTAAVAMNDSSSYTADGTDVDQSICPAGWTLPTKTTGTGKVSWNDIYSAYSSATWYSSPLYFTLAGGWDGSSNLVGFYGAWWSREVKSSSCAYALNVNSDGDVYPSLYNTRYYGQSVRCISR